MRAGDNFGWSERRGPVRLRQRPTSATSTRCPRTTSRDGFDYPVAAFDHDPPPGWPCSSDSGHGISGGQRLPRRPARPAGQVRLRRPRRRARVLDRRPPRCAGDRREATVHEMQLYDTDGTRLRMTDFAGRRPRRPALRHRQPSATSTCWPRPTGRSGRSSAPDERAGGRTRWSRRSRDDLVAYYDFEHPFGARTTPYEARPGPVRARCSSSSTAASRCASTTAPTRAATTPCSPQVNPTADRQRRWKAGVWNAERRARRSTPSAAPSGITVMGWFKMTGTNPSRTRTREPRRPLQRDRPRRRAVRQLRRPRRPGAARADPGRRRAQAGRPRPAARRRGVADLRGVARTGRTLLPARRVGAPRGDVRLHRPATMALYRNGRAARRVLHQRRRPVAASTAPGTSRAPTRAASRSAARSRRTPPSATRATAGWTA